MTTHKMESLIYTYFESGSLVIVPRVTKNNAWLDIETDPMIWRSIVNHECDMLIVTKNHYLTEVEIKISLSDLKADFKKKHQHKDKNIKKFLLCFSRRNERESIEINPKRVWYFDSSKKRMWYSI